MKKKVDKGKIMALKNAGWAVKDIASEMGMDPANVSNIIWREKHKENLQRKRVEIKDEY